MFWRALWSELRVRLRCPLLVAAALVGLIVTAIFIVGIADRNMPPEAIPLRAVLLPLLITATWSACAYPWLLAPSAEPESGLCRSCGFSLAGHSQQPERCPECGTDPAAPTWKHTTARRMVLAIGCSMLAWALRCCIFAFLSLALWRSGSLDV